MKTYQNLPLVLFKHKNTNYHQCKIHINLLPEKKEIKKVGRFIFGIFGFHFFLASIVLDICKLFCVY